VSAFIAQFDFKWEIDFPSNIRFLPLKNMHLRRKSRLWMKTHFLLLSFHSSTFALRTFCHFCPGDRCQVKEMLTSIIPRANQRETIAKGN
jgi:hypothetical protein